MISVANISRVVRRGIRPVAASFRIPTASTAAKSRSHTISSYDSTLSNTKSIKDDLLHKDLHCAGCGVELPSREKVAAPFNPTLKQLVAAINESEETKARINNETIKNKAEFVTYRGHGMLCQRCFSAKHYGQLVPTTIPDSVFDHYITTLKNRPFGTTVLVKVIDIFDFHDSLIQDIQQLLSPEAGPTTSHADKCGEMPSPYTNKRLNVPVPMIVVVNKVDLLPADVSLTRIETWARQQLSALGLCTKPEVAALHQHASAFKHGNTHNGALKGGPQPVYLHSVHVMSAKKRFGVGKVVDSLMHAKGEASHLANEALQLAKREVSRCRKENDEASAAYMKECVRQLQKGRYQDVFVMGAPNVGKSSLINAILSRVWHIQTPESEVIGADDKKLGSLVIERHEAASVLDIASKGSGDITDSLLAARKESNSYDQAYDLGRSRGYLSGRANMGKLEPEEAEALDSALQEYKAKKDGYTRRRNNLDQLVTPQQPTSSEIDISITRTDLKSANSKDQQTPLIPFSTSPLPGTTLGVIGAPIDEHGHSHIFDTPGIIVNEQKQKLFETLIAFDKSRHSTSIGSTNIASKLVPTKRRQFPIYRLSPGRSLFLGGLARLDYLHDDAATPLLFCICSHLPAHATRTDAADDLWSRHIEQGADEGALSALLTPSYSPLQLRADVHMTDILRPGGFNSGHIAMRGGASMGVGNEAIELPLTNAAHFLTFDNETHEAEAVQKRNSPLISKSQAAKVALRRKERIRQAFVDLCFGGIGWISVTPVPVRGMQGWQRAIEGAQFKLHACNGVKVHVRPPLLPYECSGTSGSDWLD